MHAIAVPLLASALLGAAVFAVVWVVARALATEDLAQDDEWRYDVSRINELRRISFLYRAFQPVMRAPAALNRRAFRDQLPEINRQILAAGHPRFWTAEEWLAKIELQALIWSVFIFYGCIRMMGPPGVVLGAVLTILVAWLMRRRLARQAEYRLFRIKLRLPYLLDLLTLLMEAGATFLNALRESCHEFRDHPVGVEFGRVLAEMNMGKSRTAALEALKSRLSDDEITSIVGAIIQGEQLGTPLAILFRTQSDFMRIKRTQRAETIAGEAAVKMLAPAVLIMGATVIIILGPFILSFITGDFLG
jgi:tight adherence protein C